MASFASRRFYRVALAGACVAAALVAADAALPAASAVPSPPPGSSHRATTAAAAPFADWDTYHGNRQRTGYAPTLKPVAQTPASVWNLTLDGAVYGSPVIVQGGLKIVATENNTVYRISGNRVIWSHHLGIPVPLASLPCGNIDPLGITGTPAYDRTTHTVVVVSELANPIRHVAVGLDPVTGVQRWYRNVDVAAAGIIPKAMQQRGALLVSGRRVYIPYGGLTGDCSSYKGSVIGVDLDHPTSAALWKFVVPTAREAGIWAPPGPSENPGGGLLVAVGNGASTTSGPYDYSDSVLRIAYQQIRDSFSPSTWRTDNQADLDLGSQGPAIVGSRVFIAGKSGTTYVLSRSHLGGIGGEVTQRTDLNCHSFGGTAVLGNVVYVPCTDGLRAIRIEASGFMTPLWHAPSNINGSPVIGGGRVWVLDTGAGRLHLLSPSSGADLLSLAVGSVTRFATPALYANAVFVGTTSGIRAFNW
ncbi:MAG: hypothetical protein DLM58_02055 [Pseudonocardiales bacterium]|nr:MAG: hypothetical protein DLM58_02055 [Pseudonocardiales bacterium]